MPTSPTREFSFERDIQPFASRYFDTIGNDPRLSQERIAMLQGSFLDGIEDIESQRRKNQAERDSGVKASLDARKTQSGLEEARAKRIKMQQDTEAINGAKSRVMGVLGDPEMTPEQKRQSLAIEELNHPLAGDQELGKVFNLGREALPKEKDPVFSPSQRVGYMSKLAGKVAPEELSRIMQDPQEMAVMLQRIDTEEKEDEEARNLNKKNDAASNALKQDMARKRLKYDEDNAGWMTEESTRDAESVIQALGTPEEQKAFLSLKGSPSDKERKELVEMVQDRKMQEILSGKSGTPAKKGAADPGDVESRRAFTRSLIFKK